MPYCFSRWSIKFQGHMGHKVANFDPNWAFPTVTPISFTDGFQMMHKVWCIVEQVSYNFFRSSIKFQGHMDWKSTIESNLSKITRPVIAIKSVRFALFFVLCFYSSYSLDCVLSVWGKICIYIIMHELPWITILFNSDAICQWFDFVTHENLLTNHIRGDQRIFFHGNKMHCFIS